MNKEEKFLPIGSVVLLKEAVQKVMITGFLLKNEEDGQVYDYCGCIYPFGELSLNAAMMFNHDKIDTVFFKGYTNDEEVMFKKQLNEIVASGKVEELFNQAAAASRHEVTHPRPPWQ